MSGNTEERSLERFNSRRRRLQIRGMTVLAVWAVVNLSLGSVLYFLDDARSAFHQMNVFWNLVNAGLAAGGLVGSSRERSDRSLTESVEGQHKVEKIFLLNTGLDLGYVMGGLYLRELATRFPDWAAQLPGWGAAIVLQGMFLLIFDAAMVWLHSHNREYRPLLAQAP